MTKEELLTYIEKTKDAPTCCAELKAACETYLKAIGSDALASTAQALVKEAQEDVCTIDNYLGFLNSEAAEGFFGEKRPAMIEEAQKAKDHGEKYCLCDACQNGAKIITYADVLLK